MLRWSDGDIYIAGTGAYLGQPVPAETAIADGDWSQAEAARTRQVAAAVAPATPPPDLAVRAGRDALASAGMDPRDVSVSLHAIARRSGLPIWNSATYIQRELGITHALPSEIRMACAGGIVAAAHASAWLARPDMAGGALITTADTWPAGIINRWRTSRALIFGDGAAAVVLSRVSGWARIVALAIKTDPQLEGLLRGATPIGADPEQPIDLQRRADDFLRDTLSKRELWQRRDANLRAVVTYVTSTAGIKVPDVPHVALPFLAWPHLSREIIQPLGLSATRTTWEYGRHVGHLGAGDPWAGLHHIITSREVVSGDSILIIAVGGGYVWAAALIEVLRIPTRIA